VSELLDGEVGRHSRMALMSEVVGSVATILQIRCKLRRVSAEDSLMVQSCTSG
jgi:hypothetical protein